MSFTKCCNLRFIGENHNPIRNGVCWHCKDGALESIEKLQKQLERLEKENMIYLENMLAIKRHQEMLTNMPKLSAVYLICMKALERVEKIKEVK